MEEDLRQKKNIDLDNIEFSEKEAELAIWLARETFFISKEKTDSLNFSKIKAKAFHILVSDILKKYIDEYDNHFKGNRSINDIEWKTCGKVKKCLCPFHEEKTPSLALDTETMRFHCYGCGASGDASRGFLEKEEK